jgi:galactokinase
VDLFVPGRICLFGEHSDWAGGYRRGNPTLEKGATILCGTDQGVYAEVAPHPNALVLIATQPSGEVVGPHEIPMLAERLRAEAEGGGFWSYAAGTAHQVALRHRVGGLVLHNHRTDLPIRKGLSSSAAICVLTARGFNRVYGLGLSIREEMELAYLGEITTPSRCGRMDQGCAFGGRPILMEFDGDALSVSELPVGRDVHLVLVDLCAHKDTPKILARLHSCFPTARSEVDRGVQQLLGPLNRQMVSQAADALEAGDAKRLGLLMAEAQILFDRLAAPACADELASPVLHRVLAYGPLRALTWGGKGVGSQGDGTAQFVARSEADQRAAVDVAKRDLGLPCLTLTLRRTDRPFPS